MTELFVETLFVQWCLKIYTECKVMERPPSSPAKSCHEREPVQPASQGKKKRNKSDILENSNFILII